MDDTDTVQAMIDGTAAGSEVVIPAGTYMIDAARGINLKSDIILNLSGVVLSAIPNNLTNYVIVKIGKDISNVQIYNGVIKGERYEHTGSGGEWGMGLWIAGKNVSVNKTNVRDCWGDGIYIQDASNVLIDGVISESSRRQGLSVIAVDGLVVRNSIFRNIGGTAPGDGIDLETDNNDQAIQNVLIERNQFYNTTGSSVGIGSPFGIYKNIVVSRTNTYDHKTQPIWVSGNAGKLNVPIWAAALSVFKGQPWYRYWGYPVEYVKN